MEKRFFIITTRDYPGKDRQESDSWVMINGFQSFLGEIAKDINIEAEIKKSQEYGLDVDEKMRFELAMYKLFDHEEAAWTKEGDAFNREILCFKRTYGDIVALVMPCTGKASLPDGIRERYLGNCIKLISRQFSIVESNLIILAHSKDVGWESLNPGFVRRQDIKYYAALDIDINKYRIYAFHHYGDIYDNLVKPVCFGNKEPVYDTQKFFPVEATNESSEDLSLWDKMKALNDVVEL